MVKDKLWTNMVIKHGLMEINKENETRWTMNCDLSVLSTQR